ncbi:MAG: LptF/LptG family permease, partial [Gammaproteobacteria bacterium]
MKLALSPKFFPVNRFPISIIDRYLIWEVYKTFFAVAVVLVLIIFSNNFVRSLEKIITGQISNDVLWHLLGLDLLQMIGLLLPPAFFFAVLISLGRLYRDSEIIAMQTSGVGPLNLFRAYLLAAVPVIALVSYLVLVTLPWANLSMVELRASQDRDKSTFASIETGKFLE